MMDTVIMSIADTTSTVVMIAIVIMSTADMIADTTMTIATTSTVAIIGIQVGAVDNLLIELRRYF